MGEELVQDQDRENQTHDGCDQRYDGHYFHLFFLIVAFNNRMPAMCFAARCRF